MRPGTLRPGQHVSLMGADGPGKSEIDPEELLRARIVCDEWEQASHNGDIARAVEAGRIGRDDVLELGLVLSGAEVGRRSESEITAFDSTGLAVQDLAVARADLRALSSRSGGRGLRRSHRDRASLINAPEAARPPLRDDS